MGNKFDNKIYARNRRLHNHEALTAENITMISQCMNMIAILIANGRLVEADIKEDIDAILDSDIQWFKEEG